MKDIKEKGNFYITTPIFYPNAKLHMGHAYTTTLADSIVRFHRIYGDRTYFLTGADENTQKLDRAAKQAGEDTSAYLDEIISNFKSLFSNLSISYDQFIRTSDKKVHWPGAQKLWEHLEASGDLKKRRYEGYYCVGHESFITEKELVDGKCPDHKEKPELISEENYFFTLSKYTDEIKKKILSNEFHIVPDSRRNEVLSFLDQGVADVSFSRPKEKSPRGIPVPNDPSQIIYVWCDALVNYISALGYGREDTTLFQEFWPADLHVIGKDILRFHAVIWPGMLLSAGLPLPRKLLVHGFITAGGQKMSKTLGNVVNPEELIHKYGTDALRYVLLRHISPFEDGDITQVSFHEYYEAHLVKGLGNLVSRILTMTHKANISLEKGKIMEIKKSIISGSAWEGYRKSFTTLDVRESLNEIWKLIGRLDREIQEKKPFQEIKYNEAKAKPVLEFLIGELYRIGILLEPLLPETAENIKALVLSNTPPDKALFPRLEL